MEVITQRHRRIGLGGFVTDSHREEKRANFIPILKLSDRRVHPISVQQKGRIAIQMKWLKNLPPFDNAEKRDELFKRIENIPGLRITEAGMEGFPKIPISSLTDKTQLQSFTDTLDWIMARFELRPLRYDTFSRGRTNSGELLAINHTVWSQRGLV